AVAKVDAAYTTAREGADSTSAVPRGSARGHRRSQPGATGLGQLLPYRKRRQALYPARYLCLEADAPITPCAQGVPSAAWRGGALDARVLLEPRALPPERHCTLPGDCVMRRPERPPVSRVREIRMHGLNGGLVQINRSQPT